MKAIEWNDSGDGDRRETEKILDCLDGFCELKPGDEIVIRRGSEEINIKNPLDFIDNENIDDS